MSHSLPIDRWTMDELVPHAGQMVLLDRVIAATDKSLVASATVDKNSPFYAGGDSLPAWWAIEYLAQGVAALAGLRERVAGRGVPWGFLTSCRRFNSSAAVIKLGSEFEVAVTEMVSVDAGMAAFDCTMTGDGFTANSVISVYGAGTGKGRSDDE